MISPELRARIRRMFYAEHWKMGTIAAELGVHRDTVALAVEPERFVNNRSTPPVRVARPVQGLRAHHARAVSTAAGHPPFADDPAEHVARSAVSNLVARCGGSVGLRSVFHALSVGG
jgi:hypothetical protein